VLLESTLTSVTASLNQNPSKSPVVLITGDLLGHGLSAYVCGTYYAAQKQPMPSTCPTSPGALAPLVDQITTNTFNFVSAQIRKAVGDVPVIYAPGNIDTFLGGAGPDTDFLSATANIVYTQLLNGSGDESAFNSTYEAGGYYSVQPMGSKLRVIVLDSNSFVGVSPTFTGAQTEIQWLDQQLQLAKNVGQKVWILMHVPPGINSQSTAQVAAVPGDVDAADLAMMWDSATQSSFFNTLGKYPGVVTMMLAGHTHMDEYRILPTGDVLEQLPGISPCFGNNPAYKVITIRQDDFTPTDYQSYYYNLSATPPVQFSSLYQYSTAYGVNGTALAGSLQQLYPQLNSSELARDTYSLLYASGTTAVNPANETPWNPINGGNWPIFGCTIGYANQKDYLSCVSNH
jgi:sphingomyelin phosphodiesterase acid-like 3